MEIISGVSAVDDAPAHVRSRFKALLQAGAELLPAGQARHEPDVLLRRYRPGFAVELFDATYFLSDYRYDEALGFFVGYVVLGEGSGKVRRIYPRIFYKDSSLLWRVASHYVHDYEEYWVGKGDVRVQRVGDEEYLCSVEETTNLPYEVQAAFDSCSRTKAKRRDDQAVELVLREAPSGRVAPYADFTTPRRRANAEQKINGGRRVARFLRAGDPESLRFAKGYEPDLRRGVVERSTSSSRFFGGELRKFRVLSSNGKIQYMFFASPTHAWLNPPQPLTQELSTYGVRMIDVHADEDLFVPGFEYHEENEDGEILHSQIPRGFAGAPHPDDPSRSDASAWLDALPIIREFRQRLLR